MNTYIHMRISLLYSILHYIHMPASFFYMKILHSIKHLSVQHTIIHRDIAGHLYINTVCV
jgi:hypothetical protein